MCVSACVCVRLCKIMLNTSGEVPGRTFYKFAGVFSYKLNYPSLISKHALFAYN